MRALLVLLVLAPTAALAVPEDPGPYLAASETDNIQVGPSLVSALICEPSPLDSPRPVLALASSSVDGPSVLQGLCLQYASYGFLVAVPNLGFANTQATSIGQTLLDTLSFFESENQRAGSRYQGRVDTLHRGVVGFNTGAMGALQAALLDDTLSVAVGLDPEDVNGQARAMASQVQTVPVLLLRADPDLCNDEDSFSTVYPELPGPRSTLHVFDSSACDVESPDSTNCQYTCAAQRPYAANLFLRYATAYAGYFAGCLDGMRSYVDGAGLKSDLEQAGVDSYDAGGLPPVCGPYVIPDAGPPDAGPAVATAGCGCAASSAAGSGTWIGVLLLAAVAARRRSGGSLR